jgi:hypothetical protein
MRRTLFLSAVCAGLSWPALSSPAFAQRDAASKPLGDAYYFYAAKTFGNHAADHVQILRQFISTSGVVPFPTDWIEDHVRAVRTNLSSAGWAYTQLSPRIQNDPSGQQQLTEIRQQQAQVLKICDQLDAACAKPAADLKDISPLVDELQSSLSGERALQQELAFEFGGSVTWQGDQRAYRAPAINP